MPIYEFACRDCGTVFEKLVRSASSQPELSCPSCQSQDVKKKLSTFAANVKGGSGGAWSSSASCGSGSV
jgi:putative FmdB family regulatory protein